MTQTSDLRTIDNLNTACLLNDIESFKKIYINPEVSDVFKISCLCHSAANDLIDIFKFIVEQNDIDIKKIDYVSLCAVIDNNHFEIFEILVNKNAFNLEDYVSDFVSWVSLEGYPEILTLLLKEKHIDFSNLHNELSRIVSYNNVNIIKLLIDDGRVDFSQDNNYSIRSALFKNNFEAAKLIWTQPKVQETLKKEHLDVYNFFALQNKIEKF